MDVLMLSKTTLLSKGDLASEKMAKLDKDDIYVSCWGMGIAT